MQNLIWIHYLRTIAMLMVITLHSAAPLLYKFDNSVNSSWMTGNLYDSFVRPCVPIFFMISGCLLLNKNETITSFIKKRLNKIITPLVAWSVLYIIWKVNFEGAKFDPSQNIVEILFSPAYYHLWFIYSIIGLYLAVPIIRPFTSSASNSSLLYFIIIWFAVVALLPWMQKVLGVRSRYELNLFTGFLGYLVLGAYLGRLKYTRKHAILSTFAIATSFLITTYGTYHLSKFKGSLDATLYDYLAPTVIISACAWMILIKYIADDSAIKLPKILTTLATSISTLSFGIYLVHAMIITALKYGTFGFKMSALYGNSTYSIPLTITSTLIISYIIIYVISKTPILNRTI
ncbi:MULTISPECIES: acyltransferase [unclassified Pseudomonas]|uniref:acyltransferase n=1 Tax=unclassified Pseudomonas TaxID=196821 RepID=UPI000A1DF7C5|nr:MULTISPECIES: acyltransferase family protein [unclassified Pseudomonas]